MQLQLGFKELTHDITGRRYEKTSEWRHAAVTALRELLVWLDV
jgi:hypothetical protein